MSRLFTAVAVLLLCVSVFSPLVKAKILSHRHADRMALPALSAVKDAAVPTTIGSVYYNSGSYSFKAGVNDSSAVAMGTFKDGLNITGWGELWIQTNPAFNDDIQMFAAGYLEGALTANRISEMWSVLKGEMGRISPAVTAFLNNQTAWVRTNIAKAAPTDTKWQGMALIMQQLDGLTAGYNANPSSGQPLTPFEFNLLQLDGDWGDILTAVDRESRPNFDKMNKKQIMDYVRTRDHCSVLVKLTGDLSELYAAHSTWYNYDEMNRIFKHYNLQLSSSFVAAKKVSFSSYPGFLESTDDFYYMDSGLVMLETTNDIFNMSLFDLVVPQSLFAWQRVRLASQNAHTGEEWYQHLAWHNSGTYNNQYAIVDFKLYTPGHPLVPNTLWVMEQIPGEVEGGDQTALLTFGYFPSYNVPFFEHIYNVSGYTQISSRLGDIPGLGYQNAPRAQIFRRDQGLVSNLTAFQNIMRYNNYKHDPISKGDPFSAICSRGDLDNADPSPFGCIDTKVTSFSLYKQGVSYIANGPTTSGGILPPFSWSQFPGVFHANLPEVFDFGFIPTQW